MKSDVSIDSVRKVLSVTEHVRERTSYPDHISLTLSL